VSALSRWNHPTTVRKKWSDCWLTARSRIAPTRRTHGRWGLGWVHYKYRKVPPLRVNLGNLTGVAHFISESPDDPVLAGYTGNLFRASPPRTNSPFCLMELRRDAGRGKHNYENRIVSSSCESAAGVSLLG